MNEYCISKFRKGVVKLVCKADAKSKTLGYELVYSLSDCSNISNMLISGEGFTSYIYEWSFDRKNSIVTVKSTSSGKITQNVKIGKIDELIDVMFEYSTKQKHKKVVVIKR